MTKSTSISGYLVELDVEGAETTQCFVSKESYSASLACLMGEGELTGPRDATQQVPQSVIDQIENWAVANGY